MACSTCSTASNASWWCFCAVRPTLVAQCAPVTRQMVWLTENSVDARPRMPIGHYLKEFWFVFFVSLILTVCIAGAEKKWSFPIRHTRNTVDRLIARASAAYFCNYRVVNARTCRHSYAASHRKARNQNYGPCTAVSVAVRAFILFAIFTVALQWFRCHNFSVLHQGV